MPRQIGQTMWSWLVQTAPSQVLLDLYTEGVLDDSIISVTVVDEDAPESDLIIAIAGHQRLYTVAEQVSDAEQSVVRCIVSDCAMPQAHDDYFCSEHSAQARSNRQTDFSVSPF